ncbi:MAG: serine kinase [Synergistaceae bacterium]|nr:serine kinase [Synergistaceae bacterium]
MNIAEICEALELEVTHPGDGAREIEGVIVGDLLSHILGEAGGNWLWVTIQTHINVVAVAVLKELPMIILSSGRMPLDDMAEKCREENIALAVTPLSSYEVCRRLCALGIGC